MPRTVIEWGLTFIALLVFWGVVIAFFLSH